MVVRMIVIVGPQNQHLSPSGCHINRLPHWQKHFGRYVPERQSRDDPRFGMGP